MTNHAKIKCPECGHDDADVFALFATNEGTRVKLRCLGCRSNFDIAAKQDSATPEWGKYFKKAKVDQVTKSE